MDARRRLIVTSKPHLATAAILLLAGAPAEAAPANGRAAIVAANRAAKTASAPERFVGGLQVFDYSPGRLYEVWTAPLRVTTLTLAPGETVSAIAAGDTERWQIAEMATGEGSTRRAHVMIKPLETGLETNLVLTTNRRLYPVLLRSGGVEAFNALVAWDREALTPPAPTPPPEVPAPPPPPPPLALDARYRLSPRGLRPAWTPLSVMTDGARTFIAFPPSLAAEAAPVLVAVDADGAGRLINYRQQDGLYVADMVLTRAELRGGERRPRVVEIRYVGGKAP